MRIETPKVMALADEIREKSRQIKADLDELDQKTTKLRQSWDGDAKEAYNVAQNAWNKKIGEMEQLLGSIGTKVNEVAADYNRTDQKGAQRFQA